MNLSIKKTSIFSFSLEKLELFLGSNGFNPLFAKKILSWVYSQEIYDPAEFLEISVHLRKFLQSHFSWELPSVESVLKSQDGSEKFLLKTEDDLYCEFVLMPFENRITICISSQVGCAQGCSFCQTGKFGLFRNLRLDEVMTQVYLANLHLKEKGSIDRVRNIVFMGMGEPLDNYAVVLEACKLFIEPSFFNLARRRVTVSTAGVVPAIEKLGKDLPVSLAVSLHNAIDDERSKLMPINKRHPLTELRKALQTYPTPGRQYLNIEYVMIDAVNDSVQHAEALGKFLEGLNAQVNLIPLNHHPGIAMKASEEKALQRFKEVLRKYSVHALVRFSRAQDISGACGQLAMKKLGQFHLHPRKLKTALCQKPQA